MHGLFHRFSSIVCAIALLASSAARGNPEGVEPRDITHETLAYYLLLIQAPEKAGKAEERFKILEKQQVVPAGGWKAGKGVTRTDLVVTLYALLHPKGSGGIKTVDDRRVALEKKGVTVSLLPEALARTAMLLGRTKETRSVLNRINLMDPALLTKETLSGAFSEKGVKGGLRLKKDGTLVSWEGGKESPQGRWELHVEDREISWTLPDEDDTGLGFFIINQNMIGFAYGRIGKTFFREGTPTEESSEETLKAMLAHLPPARDVGEGAASSGKRDGEQGVDRTDPQEVAEAFWKAVLAHRWREAALYVHAEDREWFLRAAPKQILEVANPPKHPVIKVEFKDDDLGTTRVTNWKEWEVGLDMIMRGGTWWISN